MYTKVVPQGPHRQHACCRSVFEKVRQVRPRCLDNGAHVSNPPCTLVGGTWMDASRLTCKRAFSLLTDQSTGSRLQSEAQAPSGRLQSACCCTHGGTPSCTCARCSTGPLVSWMSVCTAYYAAGHEAAAVHAAAPVPASLARQAQLDLLVGHPADGRAGRQLQHARRVAAAKAAQAWRAALPCETVAYR